MDLPIGPPERHLVRHVVLEVPRVQRVPLAPLRAQPPLRVLDQHAQEEVLVRREQRVELAEDWRSGVPGARCRYKFVRTPFYAVLAGSVNRYKCHTRESGNVSPWVQVIPGVHLVRSSVRYTGFSPLTFKLRDFPSESRSKARVARPDTYRRVHGSQIPCSLLG